MPAPSIGLVSLPAVETKGADGLSLHGHDQQCDDSAGSAAMPRFLLLKSARMLAIRPQSPLLIAKERKSSLVTSTFAYNSTPR